MPIRLNTIWKSYISAIPDCLQSRKYYGSIMDDPLLFSPKKNTHGKIGRFPTSIAQNGLKLLPRKCQIFRKVLQYMENTILIKDRSVCAKPMSCR